ncbi:MAG: transposase [candidate division Zixibacteria bacterium]|nr:transposase [candidate division Zixibacteria bacterium]
MVVRKRLNISGPSLVFITTTVRDWIPVFENDKLAAVLLGQLKEALEHFHVEAVGYVLMPSHLHALLYFHQIERLSQFMQSFKILSAKKLATKMPKDMFKQMLVNDCFRLWKPRFDDLMIKSKEQFLIKLEYIHNNPVKKGLVLSAIDWKYSSAGDWHGSNLGIIPINKNLYIS